MPLPKPLSKSQILAAMSKTKSNMSAARYLGISYQHYKKWAKNYDATEPGFDNLFEQHKNESGKGIPKFIKGTKKEPALVEIMEGRVSASHFDPKKLKYRLIEEGYLAEECSRCKFNERRVLDYKIPLLLHFKDKNKLNYSQNNIELLCYNHYFLLVSDVFTPTDEKQIESHTPLNQTTDKINWEIDDYHLKRLKELGLDNSDEDDPHQYISRL